MNREDIIRMAREAGLGPIFCRVPHAAEDCIERFATLVAEHEREACAKACEARVPTYLKDGERWLKGQNGNPDKRLKDIAPNLEAAWEAEQLLKKGAIEFITEAHACATAIRARGQA